MEIFKIKKNNSFTFLKKSINKKIIVYTKTNEKIRGNLFAFDSFFNLILIGDVHSKTKYISFTKKRKIIFIEGDQIIYVKFCELNRAQ